MSHAEIDSIDTSLYTEYFLTGSSVICNPPVTNTDIDVMFHTKDPTKFLTYLITNQWKINGEGYEGKSFISMRKDKYNLLMTSDVNYFTAFEEATKVATKLNLLKKEDRIALFNYVINGEI